MNEQDQKLIERYLAGRLSDEEQNLLQSRREDPAFEEELQFQVDLKQAAISHERDQVRSFIRSEEDSLRAVLPQQGVTGGWYWVAAAVLLLLIAAVFMLSPKMTEGHQLFSEYYERYPNTVSPITKSDPTDIDGYQAYELGDFELAVSLLTKIDSDTAKFYLGLAHLGQNRIDRAEQILFDLHDRPGAYNLPAIYYSALIAIRQNDFSNAKMMLTNLAERNHPLASRAAAIISKLPD